MIKVNVSNILYDLLSVYMCIQNKIFILPISSIKYGIQEIWTLIRSCFGSGFWRSNYKWVNSEKWKN